ncbi:MAG: triose-phosphate isomerase [Planctomycetota bacterium]|nr:triose-phosphate isomerase [Planctomycetota bacterium]
MTTPSNSRKPLIAGNWKMNLDRKSVQELVGAVSSGIVGRGDVDVAFFPPYVYLPEVLAACEGTGIMVGSQNASEQAKGAFTGEISVSMLKDIGVPCVLIGHSERRHVYGETLEQIHAKVAIALEAGLQVMLCIGETLEEREGERTEKVCAEQLSTALAGVSRADLPRISLAYEPVWAIGTGVVATPEQAASVHQYVRGVLAGLFDDSGAQSTRILYGGSVKADNVTELMSVPDIDGALVGGASLAANTFLPIIEGALG